MATVKADTPLDERGPPEGSVYDGFISYSHAADDLLAPRLQAGLQRFAKPWWKRRALRIFRDESSLSANPHLWSSITEALDESSWFVLLLSPDAAQSPWVNNEVEYWLEHKDPERIIPVLTDGDFGWADGDITGDAAPGALQAAFADEPRWVDLSFARDDDQLDLQDPRFADAVADIASAIRGVPKDELASEEVRQHRRTRRTAFGAGIALLALAVAAGGAALFANAQRIEADDQRATAEVERNRADNEAERANAAAAEAEQNALVAKSRELAAASVSALGEDPELAMLLAMESIAQLPPGSDASPSGVLALRQAMAASRLISRYPFAELSEIYAELSLDGSVGYYSSRRERSVVAVDLASGTELWRYHDPTTIDNFEHLTLSPDLGLLAVSIKDLAVVEDEAVAVDDDGNDAHPARVVVLSADTGDVVTVLKPGACPTTSTWPHGFSPDGRWLAVRTGEASCEADPAADWVSIYDTSSWEEQARLSLDGELTEMASFSADSSRVLVHGFFGDTSELRSWPELELISTIPTWQGQFATLSPDGSRVAASRTQGDVVDLRPVLFDAETGELRERLEGIDDFMRGSGFTFSDDGSLIGVVTRANNYVHRTDTGALVADLGEVGTVLSISFSEDNETVLTGATDALLVWDISAADTADGTPIELPDDRNGWINPNTGAPGPYLATNTLAWRGDEELTDLVLAVLDPNTGATTHAMAGQGAQLADGRFIISQHSLGEEDPSNGPIVVWDPSTGSTEVVNDCVALESELQAGTESPCRGPVFTTVADGNNVNPIVASVDGSYFLAQATAFEPERAVRVWDTATLQVRTDFSIPREQVIYAAGPSWLVANDTTQTTTLYVYDPDTGDLIAEIEAGAPTGTYETSPDGSMLFAIDVDGGARVFDSTTWQEIVEWEAHDTFIRGIAISADGARLATTGEDNVVKVWDVSSLGDADPGRPVLVDRVPAPKPSDAAWLDTETLVIFLAQGAQVMTSDLSIEALTTAAQQRITRGFTQTECDTYQIDPCPTLEEIRSR